MHAAIGILGPTASGKSAIALRLAEELGGEIVSCDSMQVYRGLDIGTAKPSQAEQERIPHHLVDILSITESFDVASFCKLAEEAIQDVRRRGKLPIVCGGTGYYAKALFYGQRPPPRDADVRRTVEEDLARQGEDALMAELAARDPASAERVQGNQRRLVRALEIVRLTGQPVPSQVPDPPDFAGQQFVVIPSPAIGRRRIAQRTRQMLAAGWIEETADLVAQGLLSTPTAGQALGYPQIADWLARGNGDREALAARLITLTCQYAKRQRTWFRHQHPGARVMELAAADEIGGVVARIKDQL